MSTVPTKAIAAAMRETYSINDVELTYVFFSFEERETMMTPIIAKSNTSPMAKTKPYSCIVIFLSFQKYY